MSEKLSTCKSCGQQVAKNAKTCPHCGAKNKRGNPILIGIIAVVLLIAVVAATGDSDEPKKVDSNLPAQTQQGGSQETENTAKEESNAFALGETAELRDITVSMVSVTESTGSTFNTPTEGNVFVLCEFEIANNSDKEITVSSMMSFEAYCDDYTCTYSLGALMEKGNKNQLDGTVAAGKKFNGVIGYEVPADWQELEVHFTPDFWSGKDIVFVAANG